MELRNKIKRILIFILLILTYTPYVLILPLLVSQSITMPKEKLENTSGDVAQVFDIADLLTEEEETEIVKAMQQLTDETGVVFKFAITPDYKWDGEKLTPGKYSDQFYHSNFSDEKGVLIVCTPDIFDGEIVRHAFIQHAGEEAQYMTLGVHSYITSHFREGTSKISDIVIKAAQKATENFINQKIEFSKEGLLGAGAVVVFLLVHSVLMFGEFFGKNPLTRKRKRVINIDDLQDDIANDLDGGPVDETFGEQLKGAIELLKEPEKKPQPKSFVGVDGECYRCKEKFENVTDGHCPHCGAPIKKDNICWE